MDVIEIQCGGCGKMMAISVEHLGAQVHCPHCQAVVQAPPLSDATMEFAGARAAASDTAPSEERESIFTSPQRDDLFDEETTRPRVELPDEPQPRPAATPHLTLDSVRAALTPTATHETPEALDDAPLAPGLERLPRKRGMLMPTLLIFLIPYSIVATVFVVLLMLNRPNPNESFERLPDPEPPAKDKKGPPRKVTRLSHEEPLPPNLVTRLKKPVVVGDVEFTPLEVRKMHAGDLALRFRTRNLSKEYAFVPLSKAFLDMPTPYTFVHTGDLRHRLYGGFLGSLNARGEPDLKSSGELLPGAEAIFQITTSKRLPDANVRALLRGGDKSMWRVQLRRGLIDVGGKSYSATAVVGVEFTPAEIVQEMGEPDDPGDA